MDHRLRQCVQHGAVFVLKKCKEFFDLKTEVIDLIRTIEELFSKLEFCLKFQALECRNTLDRICSAV